MIAGSTPARPASALTTKRTRDSNPKLACNELMPEEPLRRVEQGPGCAQDSALLGLSAAGKRQQVLFNELRERRWRGMSIGREQQREGFGEIADVLVALINQPHGKLCHFGCALAQMGRFYGTLQPPAREKPQRPGGVGGRRIPKVALERRELLRRAGRAIQSREQLGKGAHGSGGRRLGLDGTKTCSQRLGLPAVFVQPTHEWCRHAMGHQHPRCAGCPDCLNQAGPIHMVRQCKAAISAAPATRAAYEHPPGRERCGHLPKRV